ncbi:MAG: ATP synthase F1 subunit delta [Deltaproteobacteria bacterium]|nr:ATP synthase F1 subunit delta [Deltaproteobacteria bacterium]
MVSGSLARRYAKAVFELGNKQGNLDKIGGDLRSLAKAMRESKELETTLASPAIRRTDRKKILDAVMQRVGATPTTTNLMYILLEGERMASVVAISRELDAMIEAKAGRIAAEVVSAKPLDHSQLSQITASLEKLSGKKVSVSHREDPDLLGGVVAKLGDTVYDGSLRTQLRNMRDELSK